MRLSRLAVASPWALYCLARPSPSQTEALHTKEWTVLHRQVAASSVKRFSTTLLVKTLVFVIRQKIISHFLGNCKGIQFEERKIGDGYTKEELLDLFEQTTKIDETVFEKTSLSENQYLLISSDPEEQKNKIMSGSLEDEEDENDGFGLLPESLKKT